MKKIQVLGSGCAKCNKLYQAAEQVAKEMNIEFEIEKVSDLNDIMSFGVMMTPALVIDGEVKVAGKVPKPDEIKALLS